MSGPIGGVWAIKSGEFQPTNFASTQSGLQAALDYAGQALTGGEVWMAPGFITGITNLKIWGRTTLRGSEFMPTTLVRSAAATGPCITEYGPADGNTSGATHIVLRGFSLSGNGSTGNGIDIGSAGGFTLNTDAGFHHVTVYGFLGDGFKIAANTVCFSDLHSRGNTVGLRTVANTGQNKWFGVWCEGNTTGNMILESANEAFFGVHNEETVAGSQTSVDCQAGGHFFSDLNIFLTQNRTDLITLPVGISGISLQNVFVGRSAAQTWTNTFRHLAYGTGTGAVTRIACLTDTRPGFGRSYWWDQPTNAFMFIESGAITHSGTLTVNAPLTATGTTTVGVDGTSALLNVGASGSGDSAYATVSLKAGDAGGAEAVVWLERGGTQKARWMYNGNGTFFDVDQGMTVREGISGTQILKVSSAGALTVGASGAAVTKILSATATLNFDLTAVTTQDLTITVTGAALGDCVFLGVPNGSVTTSVMYSAWVSAADTVTVRADTLAVGENPASGTFRATVIKF